MVTPLYVLKNNTLRATTVRGDAIVGLFKKVGIGQDDKVKFEAFIKRHQNFCAAYELVITHETIEVLDRFKIACPVCWKIHEITGDLGSTSVLFEPIRP